MSCNPFEKSLTSPFDKFQGDMDAFSHQRSTDLQGRSRILILLLSPTLSEISQQSREDNSLQLLLQLPFGMNQPGKEYSRHPDSSQYLFEMSQEGKLNNWIPDWLPN
jgi:hypothetical protein